MQPFPSANIPDSLCALSRGQQPFEGSPCLTGPFWCRAAGKPCSGSLAKVQAPAPMCLWGDGMSLAASRICGAASLPLVPLCGAAGGSPLMPEQKFCVILIFFFSDTSVTLTEKTHARDCTGGQNWQWITDILMSENGHCDLFHKQALFLWVTWPLLLENWC